MASQLIVQPSHNIQGEIVVPGDKSISHRAVLLSSIASGQTEIRNFLNGEDNQATIQAVKALGVTVEQHQDLVVVDGVGLHGLRAPDAPIDCGNSGTSMRLLVGLLAMQPFETTLVGDASLMQRPMRRVTEPLCSMGASISDTQGKPPIIIQPSKKIHGIRYQLPMASAQVKSALLLAGLYAESPTTIIEPQPTRDHSEKLLSYFSANLSVTDECITIEPAMQLIARDIEIPGDFSSAAFFILGAVISQNTQLTIRNVGVNPTRLGFLHLLKLMGANIDLKQERLVGAEPVADIVVHSSKLTGIHIPVEHIASAIDEFPALAVAAAVAQGTTTLKGAEELRHKESDRITAIVENLQAIGADIQELNDGFVLQGQSSLRGGVVDAKQDHRIAMAFSMAALVSKEMVQINNCDKIATSFPNFVELSQQSGLEIYVA